MGLRDKYNHAIDTLSAFAKCLLGNANDHMEIFTANKDQAADAGRIKPGRVLTIPQHGHR